MANESQYTSEFGSNESECGYAPQQYLEFKLFTVAIFGTTIAVTNLLENLLLFYTFMSSQVLRGRNLIYLRCLSVCDIFVALSYIGIMSVAVLADYFTILPLFIMWHSYLRVFFAISHVTLSSSSFLLIAATLERYLGSVNNAKCMYLMGVMGRHRTLGVCLAFLLGGVLRGTVYWEIEVVHVPGCEGFASMYPALTEWPARNPYYDAIWRFWTRKITTTFLPFFVLAYCNAAIVISVHRQNRHNMVKTLIRFVTVGPNAQPYQGRSSVRAATRMLIMVVTCYLLANVLDVIIAAWEYIDGASLTQRYAEFYAIAADISSLLTVVAGALRLPIYTANDKSIKREVSRVLRSLIRRLTCARSDMQCTVNRKLNVYHKQNNGCASSAAFQPLHEQREDTRSTCSTPRIPCTIQTSVGTLIIARAYASSESIRKDTIVPVDKDAAASPQQLNATSTKDRSASDTEDGLNVRLLKPALARLRRDSQLLRSWESRI
uniref:G-protein coupled receptors family 1 profile domain-containing protein n=1 Tax=Plectus sambesii TaxID=2011161 RepID=A0A914UIX5_9BILA